MKYASVEPMPYCSLSSYGMATSVTPSYLTCTASQAEKFNSVNPHNILSLNQLLEQRAISHPHVAVAGFPELNVSSNRWELLKFSFASLLSASNSVAIHYRDVAKVAPRDSDDISKRIVALLSPSCADFLVTLFALLRLGYGVLLLAPQNTPEAIAHLCSTTRAVRLVCHPSLLNQGLEAIHSLQDLDIVPIPPRDAWKFDLSQEDLLKSGPSPEEESDLTALVMHTSGSTGMPKPIFQSHRVWTEAISYMPGDPAFTTTPLFHGGSPDVLRSMNAASTLYLFSSIYPMTVSNILGALSVCAGTTAFLSVPYILKMLAEDHNGLKMLQSMDLVSTGGAPLPEALGDDMVAHGVKLVSRLGSSECGFLMSSHRDYDNDKEWSWLRNSGLGLKLLRFEPMGESEGQCVFELIVDRKWSTRVVSNRPDGSFATGDLYAKHPTLSETWRYHGRTDDVVVLVTGKKVSANPLETALRANPAISEAIVFGASRPALGALILPASGSVSEQTILEHVQAVNAANPSYAHVLAELVVVLPVDEASAIPKTSKGSVIRPKALQVFADAIDEAYRRLESGQQGPADGMSSASKLVDVNDEAALTNYVRGAIRQALGGYRVNGAATKVVGDDDDLFNAGIDSVRAVSIRGALQQAVRPSGKTLPSNIVLEHPTITKIVKTIRDILNETDPSKINHADSGEEMQYQLMRNWLSKYEFGADFIPRLQTSMMDGPASDPATVVLTGATGSLGAHILVSVLQLTAFSVVALVRAADDVEALERLQRNLNDRLLGDNFEQQMHRVKALAATLAEPHLGLAANAYNELTRSLALVVHAAWPVNFTVALESFEPAIQGTRNLLELTARAGPQARMVFCSSIAAAIHNADTNNVIHESLVEHERLSAPQGYARSKWVAEHLCASACRNVLPGRVSIARIGQLCGDTEHGVWNESEAWPLLIATTRYTGCLPVLLGVVLSLLPFDTAARAILEMSTQACSSPGKNEGVIPIAHLVNPSSVSWMELLGYLEAAGLKFERVAPADWMAMLRDLDSRSALDAGTAGLLDIWQANFGSAENSEKQPSFGTTFAKQVCEDMRESFIWSDIVGKWVRRWRETGFISQD